MHKQPWTISDDRLKSMDYNLSCMRVDLDRLAVIGRRQLVALALLTILSGASLLLSVATLVMLCVLMIHYH